MNINTKNYQAYILDFYEGKLSEEQAAMLFDFLELHPGLKEEFESFENIALHHGSITFPDKDSLKKESLPIQQLETITLENCDEWFIAFHEGDLYEADKLRVHAFIASNPEKQKDFELFGKIKIQAEPLSFSMKESLKREEVYVNENYDVLPALSVISCDIWFAASMEGDLTPNQENELAAFLIRYPEFIGQRALFEKTKLKADESLVFPAKSNLKIHRIGAFQLPQIARVAASIGLLIGATALFYLLNRNPQQQIANLEPQSITTEISTSEPQYTIEVSNPSHSEPVESIRPTKDKAGKTQLNPQPTLLADRIVPSSLTVAPLKSKNLTSIQAKDSERLVIEENTDFEYWQTWLLMPDENDGYYEEQASQSTFQSLAHLAYSEIQRRSPLDFNKVEETFSRERFSLWGLAGAGLSGLGYLTGSNLPVEKDRDEKGRITRLAVGKRFEVTRSLSSR